MPFCSSSAVSCVAAQGLSLDLYLVLSKQGFACAGKCWFVAWLVACVFLKIQMQQYHQHLHFHLTFGKIIVQFLISMCIYPMNPQS